MTSSRMPFLGGAIATADSRKEHIFSPSRGVEKSFVRTRNGSSENSVDGMSKEIYYESILHEIPRLLGLCDKGTPPPPPTVVLTGIIGECA